MKKAWKNNRNHNFAVLILMCIVALAFGGCTDAQNIGALEETAGIVQDTSDAGDGATENEKGTGGEHSGSKASAEDGQESTNGTEVGQESTSGTEAGQESTNGTEDGLTPQGMDFKPEDLRFVTAYGETGEKTWLDGTAIVSAKAQIQYDSLGMQFYLVEIQLDEEGTIAFYEATKEHLGEKISIVKGDQVLFAPVVQMPIEDGRIVITGLNSWEEAFELAQGLSTKASGAGQEGNLSGGAENGAGQNGNEENAQIALMEQGNRLITLLNEKLHNDSYLELMGISSFYNFVAYERLKAMDYQKADGVYQITFSSGAWEKLYFGLSGDVGMFDGMSEELKGDFERQILESFVTLLVSRITGAQTVALQSILTVESVFVQPTAKGVKCIYLYVFGDSYPVAVTFSGSEDGAVKAMARFVLIDDFKAASEQEVQESMLMGWEKLYSSEVWETLEISVTKVER